jgi:hypothetical protein
MIDCICINDANKPTDIPGTHWIKKGNPYEFRMIYNMVMQEGILGVTLKEIDLETVTNGKYSCFRMDRFAFKLTDLPRLIELAKQCAELNDFNVEELLKEQVELV